MKLNNNEIFALADYLRHELAVEYPMEQYFIDKAATALEDLANERAELKHQLALIEESKRLQECVGMMNELISKYNNNH